MMFKLFDYQKDLVDKARTELAKSNSVLIQSPAGSGKSIVIAEIARLATQKGNRVMFMVHRKELVEQISNSFAKQDVNLKLCTIMTVVKIKNRLEKLPRPNLIITDETHHGLAKTYRKIYDYYSEVPRLGFTATPWRMNGEPFDGIYQSIILGKSVNWLIKQGFLAPAHYWTVDSINHDALKSTSKNSDYTSESIDEAFGKQIFGDVVDKYHKYAENEKTIVYAHSIAYSKLIAKSFKEVGINAVHVDSKTPASLREQIMNDFKAGRIKVLCNVDLISEGFDVPDCSCVIMVRPTKSLVLFIQQAMRCMRSDHQGKKGTNKNKHATIIDMVGNATHLKILPDSEIDWEATFHGHSGGDTKSPTSCQYCFGTFLAKKDDKLKAVVSDGDKEIHADYLLETWPCTTSNQAIQDWINKNSSATSDNFKAYNLILCPLCHDIAQANEFSTREGVQDKDKVDGHYVDLSDPENRKKWELSMTAKKSTRKLRSVKNIFRVFEARKLLGQSKKNPLYQTLYVLMSKADDHCLSDDQLDQLAEVSQKDVIEVNRAYRWAKSKWTFDDAPAFHFNFN